MQVLLLALDFLCCNAVLELAKDCVAVLARLVLQDDDSLDRVLDANGIPLLVQHIHILAQGAAHTAQHTASAASLLQHTVWRLQSGSGEDPETAAISIASTLLLLKEATSTPDRCERLVAACGSLTTLHRCCYGTPRCELARWRWWLRGG